MQRKHKILVCPLDWGLGHASRMVPVINALLKHGFEVVIAADNFPLQLLKNEFPSLAFIKFPSYKIHYSAKKSQLLSMLFQVPKIISGVIKEHQDLKKIIKENNFDIVISDNRFGLWNKNIFSIFVTHQVMIKLPEKIKFLEPLLYKLNKLFIKQYNQCWIPDFEEENNLSGDLSHKFKLPENAEFVGILSRFHDNVAYPEFTFKYDILAILSGPEPQRSIFEEILISQLKNSSYKTLVIKGTPDSSEGINISENLKIINHLPQDKMKSAILNSEVVICRSGYTSIMDLVTLRKKAILVPTPGQTEQEYLAEYLMKKGWFHCVGQSKFNIEEAILNLQKCNPELPFFNECLLDKQIDSL